MPADKLRIAMMIGSMQEGGAEGQLLELMRGLRARGHDVRLMLLHPRGALLESVMAEGIPVHGVGLPKLRPAWNPRGKIEAVRCLIRTVMYLRDFRPHVLHCFLFEAEAWGWLAKKCGAPGLFVTSRLNLGHYKSARPWKQFVQDAYNRLAVMTVANAKAVARDALRREKHLSAKSLHVIYNGVDVERFAGAPPADLAREIPALAGATHRVACVANLYAYKGYFDLLEAWRSVNERFPDAHLLCAGRDGGIAEELRRRIAAAGLEARVHLLGPRGDVPSLLRASDLFVLASHEEGQPNAVIEAAASGLAVVATAVGGTPEIVADGRTGLLVPPRDPERLAEAINELLSDTDKRQALGNRGRSLAARRFGMTRYIDEYEELYLSIH